MDRCLRANVALHLSRSVLSNCLGRSTMAMSFSSLFLYTTMSQHCWIPVSCNRSSRWQCKLSTLPHCSYFADTNSNSRIASSRVESSVVWCGGCWCSFGRYYCWLVFLLCNSRLKRTYYNNISIEQLFVVSEAILSSILSVYRQCS